MIKVFIVVSLLLIFCGCMSDGGEWQGFFYPDGLGFGVDESKWEFETFGTKEQCLFWGRSKQSDNPNAQFECGSNCRYEEDFDAFVCEENIEG